MAESLAAILTSVGDIVDAAIGWVEVFAGAIISNPLLLIFCVGLPVGAYGIGVLNRLIRT